MKRLYTTPELLCICLAEQDVLTASFISQSVANNDYTQGDYLNWN